MQDRAQSARHTGFVHDLVTFDRDYLDDRRFPPAESGGVLVMTAPEESGYMKLLTRLDVELFQPEVLPLEGRKLHVHVDWPGARNIQP